MQATLAIAIGFSLLALPPVAALFEFLAQSLAVVSAVLLNTFGYEVTRTGSELRNVTGWAVDVTTVCDGHGLIIAWAAIVTALRPGWLAGARAVAAGVLAILLFNLFRIIVLASTLAHAPGAFDTIHAYVFPMLTVGLMLLLRGTTRSYPVALVMIGLAAAWFFLGEAITAAVFAPLSNAVLSVVGPEGIGTIALRAPGWTVDSTLIARADPLAFHMAGVNPNDFTLAVPVLVAAALLARPVWPGLALGLPLVIAALLVGAVTALWSVAAANAVSDVAIPNAGRYVLVRYDIPGETSRAAVSLLQNVLVHLNLLVLPILILTCAPVRTKAAP